MSFVANDNDRICSIWKLIETDREAGLKELAVLAEAGDKPAIESYALYLSEETPTTEEAVKWLLRANEFDSASAAWNLAMVAREQGKPFEMRQWINRAAELGEEDALELKNNGYDVEAVLAKYLD
ncbi:hypothetical protein [uncultured Roseibium sp.]|uniref:hypothetical protein n=1 Tax=uncultured Roseibium sp. TaxID=1936171 RepID=UPI00321780CE